MRHHNMEGDEFIGNGWRVPKSRHRGSDSVRHNDHETKKEVPARGLQGYETEMSAMKETLQVHQ